MKYYKGLKCKDMILNQTYVTHIFELRCFQVVHRDNYYDGLCHVVNHLEFGVVFDSSQVAGTDAWYRDVIEIE